MAAVRHLPEVHVSMYKLLIKWVLGPILLIAVGMGAVLYFQSGSFFSLTTPEEVRSSEETIKEITREEQVVLVAVSVEGVETTSRENSEIWGIAIPGTSRESLIQYEFTAKLGIEASDVRVEEVTEDRYRLHIPKFIFIGYEIGDFYTIAESGGVLSFVKERIDSAEVSSSLLQEKRDEYIEKNINLLQDQTKFFYTTIVHGIDPMITLEFDFAQ